MEPAPGLVYDPDTLFVFKTKLKTPLFQRAYILLTDMPESYLF